MRVGLVGCVKRKGLSAAPAGQLYTSPLFVGRRRFVEATCDRWFILSALHGLVDPEQVIEPYDRSLVDAGAGERQAWSKDVLRSIDETLGDVAGMDFELHAGAAYRDFGLVDGLRDRGAQVLNPVAGLSQGQQLAFYACTLPPGGERSSSKPISPAHGPAGGYAALGDWLARRQDRSVTVAFVKLERLLGRPLPPSARRHRPWWGNNDRSSQARAWLSAGWRVAAVDLAVQRVTFERSAR